MANVGVAFNRTPILVDTNVIIEAVRTGCWNALTGGAVIETVEECRDEALRGNDSRRGYIPVTAQHLTRISRIHAVAPLARATLADRYPAALSMDKGERDLFAHALERTEAGDSVWLLSSPDRASIKAALALAYGEQLRSLGGMMKKLGGAPAKPVLPNHEERWLQACLTEYRPQNR